MTPDYWENRLREIPELKPYLLKIAKKWAAGNPLPKRMTLGSEPKEPAVQSALSRIFGRLHVRNGNVVVTIPDELREESVIQLLAVQFGITKKKLVVPDDIRPIFQRLELQFPTLGNAIDWLKSAPEVARFLKRSDETLLRQLLEAVQFLQTLETFITLSKLGALHFNDSKILRSGTVRNLLEGVLLAVADEEDVPDPRDEILSRFNIIDNPATTLVTLFGSLQLIRDGKTEGWISDRFQQGEPVTLNGFNLDGIDAVRVSSEMKTIITSENAAPFHELVIEHPEAIVLYTAGYPNAGVCQILRLLSAAGLRCLHWGDSDPSGLRIAEQVSRCIPTRLYRCGITDLKNRKSALKPLTEKKKEIGRQILKKDDFPFREELEYTLENGWLEQERF